MIKVNFKELKLNTQDLSKQLKVMTYNAAASGLADVIKKEVKNLKCEVHKDSTRGTIDVKADIVKTYTIHKHNFCCDQMKDSLEINKK